MRRCSTPCWLNGDGRHVSLERIPFTEKEFPEDFLQETLHEIPELLPVDEFDSAFGPLLSLGREIECVDNLFIAPNGWLTLVETKLWRNPESTREVVAQILDYASRLAGMGFSDFEALCRRAMPPAPLGARSLFDFVSSQCPERTPPEPEFIDSVSKSLRTGRFLLLIAGDGIREGLQSILSVLHTHPQMHFTFGLVELQMYRHPEAPAGRLIIPQIVANTVEIVRATVRVETTGHANVVVGFEPPAEAASVRRPKLSEDRFLQEVSDNRVKHSIERIFEWRDEKDLFPEWGSSSVSIRLPDPRGSRQKFTLFVLRISGSIYTGWLRDQLTRAGYDPQLATAYTSRLLALFPEFKPSPKYPDAVDITAELICERLDDLLDVVSDLVDEIREGTR